MEEGGPEGKEEGSKYSDPITSESELRIDRV